MRTEVYSAFPGTGKTYAHNLHKSILDSDSSKFDKSNFPNNYMRHIKAHLGKDEIIFVSSHKEVREALLTEGIEFILIYPHFTLKDEYLNRFTERGDNPEFVDLLKNNWSQWLAEMVNQKGCQHIVLKSGQFISNVIQPLKNDFCIRAVLR